MALSTKVGAGGWIIVTNAASTTLLTAYNNTGASKKNTAKWLLENVFNDNEGENMINVRVYVNIVQPYVEGSTNIQANLAANLADADTVQLTEILWVKADNVGLEFASGKLAVKDDGIRVNKIHASALGDGLALSAGEVVVNPDGSTLELNAGAVRVKAGGILAGHVGATAITKDHLNANVAGAGISGGAGTALTVDVDGTTIDFTGGGALEVKDGGIATAKVADGAITPVKNSEDQRYFTIVMKVDAANLAATNEVRLSSDFKIHSIDRAIEKTIAGGDLIITPTVNGVANTAFTVVDTTAQNAAPVSFTGMTAVPLPVNGATPNTLRSTSSGTATAGIVILSYLCEWV